MGNRGCLTGRRGTLNNGTGKHRAGSSVMNATRVAQWKAKFRIAYENIHRNEFQRKLTRLRRWIGKNGGN